MQVHKLIVAVIDFDGLGPEGVKNALENGRFGNRCISPSVIATESVDIGQWSDDNPLNKRDTKDAELQRLFPEVTKEEILRDENAKLRGEIMELHAKFSEWKKSVEVIEMSDFGRSTTILL